MVSKVAIRRYESGHLFSGLRDSISPLSKPLQYSSSIERNPCALWRNVAYCGERAFLPFEAHSSAHSTGNFLAEDLHERLRMQARQGAAIK